MPHVQAVRQTIHVHGPVVDLRGDCGAKGDGVSNDTGAFQKAARMLQEAGGGTLRIEAGIYIVGRQGHEEGAYPYYRREPIFVVRDVNGLLIEGAEGAVIRLADGLRYGSFDKDTGEPIEPNMPFLDRDCHVSASVMFDIARSRNVILRNLELDGNRGRLILGGQWGDTGWQLAAGGIHLFGCRDVLVENVRTHHHGQDGIMIGFAGLRESDPPTPHVLLNVISEYNGRQGLSWVGGRGLTAVRCRFNHTQRGGFGSAPGAGVDIEAEDSICRDGLFVGCEFVNNGGCGLAADTGDGGYSRFEDCLFWGTTNWAMWNTRPGMVFENCRFYGSVVHSYGSAERPELATRYKGCHFEDVEHPRYGVYRSYLLINHDNARPNVLFEDCDIVANRLKALWFACGEAPGIILRHCRITHRHAGLENGDFQSLLRGVVLDNVRFKEDLPDTARDYYIIAQDVSVEGDTHIDGPRVRWQRARSGPTGPLPDRRY